LAFSAPTRRALAHSFINPEHSGGI
jgi:hypothetical protein